MDSRFEIPKFRERPDTIVNAAYEKWRNASPEIKTSILGWMVETVEKAGNDGSLEWAEACAAAVTILKNVSKTK